MLLGVVEDNNEEDGGDQDSKTDLQQCVLFGGYQ
jgi:hypothetical protein